MKWKYYTAWSPNSSAPWTAFCAEHNFLFQMYNPAAFKKCIIWDVGYFVVVLLVYISGDPLFILISVLLFCCRKLPCSSSGSDWFTPPVDQAVADIFLNRNWSMSDPSPACQCSTPKRTIMLPDCPLGAGGLPPPQVSLLLWGSCILMVQNQIECEFTAVHNNAD